MNQPPQAGKRIVSKSEYLKVQGKKVSLIAGSNMLAVSGMLCVGLMICSCVWLIIVCLVPFFDINENLIFGIKGNILATILFGFGAYVFRRLSDASIENAEKIEDVVLLTRANTADLPALDSLVRASEEPSQEQESILLRATAESAQTPPEQLLRAVER